MEPLRKWVAWFLKDIWFNEGKVEEDEYLASQS